MKNIWRKIIALWFRLFPTKLDKINAALEKAVRDQEKQRAKLKRNISKFVLKNYKVEISEFIPPKGVSNERIYTAVMSKFGQDMSKNSLHLRRDLTWKQ